MNFLSVGRDKSVLIDDIVACKPARFLIIDDGPLIDELLRRFTFPKNWRVTEFDHHKHTFNPLKGISYQTARNFVETIDALFPAGSATLTKETGLSLILRSLLRKPQSLDQLILPPDRNSTPGHVWAYDKISDILLSPVMERVLNHGNTLSFSGTILARLNRAELGDADCLALAHFLISRYKYTVVIPDFGFYGRKSHISLIRQNRLIAGVSFLDESPLKNDLLLIDKKSASRCIYSDAKTLAEYRGLFPDPSRVDNDYNNFILDSVRGTITQSE